MAVKRFIITELENHKFILVDKKTSEELFSDISFDKVFNKAKEVAKNNVIYGITNIINPEERHPKFKGFKTPVRCAYEFNE